MTWLPTGTLANQIQIMILRLGGGEGVGACSNLDGV